MPKGIPQLLQSFGTALIEPHTNAQVHTQAHFAWTPQANHYSLARKAS